mgnify:CR=1 FL=1
MRGSSNILPETQIRAADELAELAVRTIADLNVQQECVLVECVERDAAPSAVRPDPRPHPALARRLARRDEVEGGIDDYIVLPGLGDRSGILGAVWLAARGATEEPAAS